MLLYAVHDSAGASLIPAGGWCVESVEVGLDTHAQGRNWNAIKPDINWLVRLNHSHSGGGTLPPLENTLTFAAAAASFVATSTGCTHWIIANEPNWSVERPPGVSTITPAHYAHVYNACHAAIKAVNPQNQVILAAIAPYNVESGPWIDYFLGVLAAVGACDGLAIHTFARGFGPESVTSEARMDPPFEQWHNGFRAYQDFLAVLPERFTSLPAYITETNCLEPWPTESTGWVPAAYAEIDHWNRTVEKPKIHCLALYRWENYDRWGFKDKPGVLEDFNRAIAECYTVPEKVYLPVVKTSTVRQWDERLSERGVKVVEAEAKPGQVYWQLVKGQWLDTNEAKSYGPDHHILVDALDEQGKRLTGVSFVVQWPSGNTRITTKGNSGYSWAADFAMSPSLNEFSIVPVDALPGDKVTGLGMGKDKNPGEHTSTLLVFQRAVKVGGVGESPHSPPAESPGPTVPPLPTSDAWTRSIEFVLRWEGLYANDPNDPGGETKYGISKRSYPDLDIANLTLEQAKSIYQRDYWIPSGASRMPWPLCLAVLDFAVNAGVGRVREALAQTGEHFTQLMAWRIDWYTHIPNFERFGRAWIRRCADLLMEATR